MAATGAEKNHGYVFEVPVNTLPGNPAPEIPIIQMGRMAHEAAAVDPNTGIIYETEDQGDVSGFYSIPTVEKANQAGRIGDYGWESGDDESERFGQLPDGN